MKQTKKCVQNWESILMIIHNLQLCTCIAYNFIHYICLVHVDLTNSSCIQEYSYWIKDLNLFLADRWLTDAVITAGQQLFTPTHG